MLRLLVFIANDSLQISARLYLFTNRRRIGIGSQEDIAADEADFGAFVNPKIGFVRGVVTVRFRRPFVGGVWIGSAKMVIAGISVLPLRFQLRIYTNRPPSARFGPSLAQFWSTVPPAAPRWVSLASRGDATPGNAVCLIDSADTSPFPHLVIKICCAPRAAYPAGTGSVTILLSM